MFYYPTLPLGIESNLLHLAVKDTAMPSEKMGCLLLTSKATLMSNPECSLTESNLLMWCIQNHSSWLTFWIWFTRNMTRNMCTYTLLMCAIVPGLTNTLFYGCLGLLLFIDFAAAILFHFWFYYPYCLILLCFMYIILNTTVDIRVRTWSWWDFFFSAKR